MIEETPEYQAGRQAWKEDRPSSHNPHVTNSCEHGDWYQGWMDQEPEYEEIKMSVEDAKEAGYWDFKETPGGFLSPMTVPAQWADEGAAEAYLRGWRKAHADANTWLERE